MSLRTKMKKIRHQQKLYLFALIFTLLTYGSLVMSLITEFFSDHLLILMVVCISFPPYFINAYWVKKMGDKKCPNCKRKIYYSPRKIFLDGTYWSHPMNIKKCPNCDFDFRKE